MKAVLKTHKEVEIKYLKVRAGVRYWEDATVNGVEDTDGDLIPLRDGGDWCPMIDIDRGVIVGWPKGTTADIHYKVCDDGDYYLLDASGNIVLEKDCYVPDIMCPQGGGDGDYIIMHIDENGTIDKWSPSIKEFISEND